MRLFGYLTYEMADKKEKTFKTYLSEAFSEKGVGSSKRLIGALIIVVALACTVYLTIKEGGTSVVEGLLQTAFILGTSLLGLYSVTSIWKDGQATAQSSKPTQRAHQNLEPES